MTLLTVAAIQHKCFSTPEQTTNYLQGEIASSVKSGAKLIVLQELHNTPYFCQQETVEAFDLAESIPGPSTEFLSSMAKEHQCVIVGSLFEKRAAGLYHNTAVVLDCDGSLAGRYRKIQIPDDPGFYEKFYFTPGDSDGTYKGFEPISTSVGKLGVLVCWDQWYPEAARLMTLAGADLLIYPTAIGWDLNDDESEQKRQLDAWVTIQRSHAIANNLPVLSCNRSGVEPSPSDNDHNDDASNRAESGIQFWGNSFVAGQQGELLAQAETNGEQTLLATINLTKTEQTRRIWPYLRDRRIDAYDALTKRYID